MALLLAFCMLTGILSGNLFAQEPSDMTISVIYDNYPAKDGMEGDWGFACLLETDKTKILFDTGAKADLFEKHCSIMKIDLDNLDAVVISHNHWDHTGGLMQLVEKHQGINVYMPPSTPGNIVTDLENAGAEILLERDPVQIAEGIFLTGESGSEVREQGLVLNTGQGLVVLTGCAHPGIVQIAKEASDFHGRKIAGIFGGFHLMNHSEESVEGIIKSFREFGVQFTGATHCTGEKQIEWFREVFQESYISLGSGRVLTITTEGISSH